MSGQPYGTKDTGCFFVNFPDGESTSGGRLNIAGLAPDQVEKLALALKQVW